MKPLTIGSLFSGIGGLELGLERGVGNGAHTVFQVEQNAYCRAVLAKHWPDALRYDDVRTVGAHNLAAVDVLCGGFPCQDISSAGKKAGLAGARSGLWFEYARIVRELRPSYIVVENVADLLTRGIDVVLGELAGSGYDAEWSCLSASDVGAPHLRDRLFILAYPNADGRRLKVGAQLDGEPLEDSANGHPRGRHAHGLRDSVADTDRARLEGRIGAVLSKRASERATRSSNSPASPPTGRSWWVTEPDVGRVAHGVRSRVERLRALGNAVVPQVAEVVGRLIAQREAERLERAS